MGATEVRSIVRAAAIGQRLSLARQGLELGIDYGPHSLESLIRVAETIEEAVYRTGSLVSDGREVRFLLENPPLRMGAFSAVRLWLDGSPVDPRALRVRTGTTTAWRTAPSVTKETPLELRTGVPIEVAAAVPRTAPGSTAHVRLELVCPAIPPLVWVEFRDTVRRE